jgi:hypothetical protein
MQFKSKDLSEGGIFVTTEDMSLLDIGEECDLLIDEKGEKYIETNAKVVRGARIFTDEGEQVISGYGLMFFEPDAEFMDMLKKYLP